jgi:hypothetical protein
MSKFILKLGHFLVFSKRHKSIRGGIVFLFANFLLLASIVFIVEIILIFLGMGNVYLPLTRAVSDFLSKLVFR